MSGAVQNQRYVQQPFSKYGPRCAKISVSQSSKSNHRRGSNVPRGLAVASLRFVHNNTDSIVRWDPTSGSRAFSRVNLRLNFMKHLSWAHRDNRKNQNEST